MSSTVLSYMQNATSVARVPSKLSSIETYANIRSYENYVDMTPTKEETSNTYNLERKYNEGFPNRIQKNSIGRKLVLKLPEIQEEDC